MTKDNFEQMAKNIQRTLPEKKMADLYHGFQKGQMVPEFERAAFSLKKESNI